MLIRGLFILLAFILLATAFAQTEVILQGTAQGTSTPVILFQGAINSDSVKLPLDDETVSWANQLIRSLKLSGTVQTTDTKPDTLVKGSLIPTVRMEVRKASAGGAATVSLITMDANAPHWFESYSLKDVDYEHALHASSVIQMQLTGESGFAKARVFYAGNTEHGREIYSCNSLGFDRRQHTRDTTIILSPTVSPDGKMLAYTSFRNGNADIWIKPVAGGSERILISTPFVDSAPAFSPDGSMVAYGSSELGNTEIFTIKTNSTDKQRLTYTSGINTTPSWSPKGDRLVFMSDRSGSPQIYTMASDGTDVRRITFDGEYNDSPVWSSRGDMIVYVRREAGVFQMYGTDPAGVTHKRLLFYSENQRDPCFTPGGFRISFVTVWQGKSGIALLTPETGEVDLLIGGISVQRPVWGVVTP